MNLSGLQDIIPNVAGWLHVDPATILFYLAVIGTAANIISRLIPDDATGWKANVRRIATVIGIYVPNRVSSGITVNDVAKQVIGKEVEAGTSAAIHEAAKQADALIPEVLADAANEVFKPAFPGLVERKLNEETPDTGA